MWTCAPPQCDDDDGQEARDHGNEGEIQRCRVRARTQPPRWFADRATRDRGRDHADGHADPRGESDARPPDAEADVFRLNGGAHVIDGSP